jgi:hypothetical protein
LEASEKEAVGFFIGFGFGRIFQWIWIGLVFFEGLIGLDRIFSGFGLDR